MKTLKKFRTKIKHHLLLRGIDTDIDIDQQEANDVLSIRQYQISLVNERKLFNQVAIRIDDILSIKNSKTRIFEQISFEILSGLLNLFIFAQLLLAASNGVSNSLETNQFRLAVQLIAYILALKWLVTWVYSQFIKGTKIIIAETKNNRSIELVYNDDLQLMLEKIQEINKKHTDCDSTDWAQL